MSLNVNSLSKGGTKRYRNVRRYGARVSGLNYDEVRSVLKAFVGNVIREAVTYAEHARKMHVTLFHVLSALKRRGRPLYGYSLP